MQFFVFGSQADGSASADSDLDLCVVIPPEYGDPFEIAYQVRVEARKYINMALDVLVIRAVDFEDRKELHGTLEHTIATEGIAV